MERGQYRQLNKNKVPSFLFGGVGVPDMPTKNERAELEMEMMKYRQLAARMVDEEFVRRAKENVAELEKKLREDE
jgi:hypothetical protein